jgi:dipeptidyl aminopeptidase/acylaminoacyl peptidase
MKRDIRDTSLYQEAVALFDSLRRPGTGQISDAAEVHVSPDGKRAVFAGTIVDGLEGMPPTRICLTDLTIGDTRVLTFGPNVDRLPKFAPDGRHIAFLSDRRKEGDFQLYFLDPISGAARPAPHVDGWVESLHWSPDGTRILLGVAGHGADISGGQGAVTSKQVTAPSPSWMPTVEAGDETHRGRSAWVYEVASDHARRVSPPDSNVWEASWCGHDGIAAVVSSGAGEGLWYTARLVLIDVHTGGSREVFRPQDQLGWPTASPSGEHIAVVEALCSDRGIVAGDLRLIDTASGTVRRVDTHGVDITYTEWRSNTKLLLAGHRGFETAVGLCDAASGSFVQLWSSREITTGGRYISVSGFNETGDCVLVGEGFRRAPEIGVIRNGEYLSVKSFDLDNAGQVNAIESVERINWKARDGLEIQGWLLTPAERGRPHPLVMNVHGGPVWHSRPTWLGRNVFVLMLLRRGYAVFYPNPRGSAGRGPDFARRVYGDLGGADAQDLLSGLDSLVQSGMADAQRLGVTGRSYGGFMTSWLVTQDSRFGAAVATAAHTNQVTEHLISNIPHFMAMMTQDKWNNAGGKYFDRSPIMHAHKAKTPTLNICGALDRCTPPEEAVQFHNALRESGVKSVLVTYPEEGHGIRKLPAVIDYAARVVAWFEEHIPPRSDNAATDI